MADPLISVDPTQGAVQHPAIARKVTDPEAISAFNVSAREQLQSANSPVPVSSPYQALNFQGDPLADESWYEDPLNSARALMDGVVYNWADEAGAAMFAAGASLLTDQKYSDVYNGMMDILEEDRRQFNEVHPVASVGLNVFGGIISPLNKVVAPLMAPKGATLMQRAYQNTAVGTGVGAVAGAGIAEQGEKVQGAGFGALTGGVFSGVLEGAGGVLRASTRRDPRIPDLGHGDDFKGINMVLGESEGGFNKHLANFYRDVVGKAYGSAGMIRQQSLNWVQPLKHQIDDMDGIIATTIKRAKTDLDDVTRILASEKDVADDLMRLRVKNTKNPSREAIKNMRAMSDEETAIEKMLIVQDVDSTVNEAIGGFRAQAVKNSLPEGITPAEANAVLGKGTVQNMIADLDGIEGVEGIWDKYAFNMLKARKFRFNSNKLVDDMMSKMDASDKVLMRLNPNSQKPEQVGNILKEFMSEFSAGSGWVDGSDLSKMRSQLGSITNKMNQSDPSNLATISLTRMKDTLNDAIEAQLRTGKDTNALNAFIKQKEQWKNYVTLKDASSKAANRGGAFSPDDWISVQNTGGRRGLGAKGQLLMQKQAQELSELSRGRDALIKQRATQSSDEIMARYKTTIDAEVKKLDDQLEALNREKLAAKKLRREDAYSRKQAAKNEEAVDALKQQRQEITDEYDRLMEFVPKDNISMFERIFATTVVMAALTPLTGAGAIPLGALALRAMASPNFQRFIVKQTKAQEAAFKAIEASASTVRRTTVGAVTAASGGMSTGDAYRQLATGSEAQQASAYIRLMRSGKLEDLRRKNPRVYAQLKKAFDDRM